MTLKVKLENILEAHNLPGELYAQCCVCHRYRLDPNEYEPNTYTHVPAEEMVNKTLSHTYCPKCAEKIMKEYKRK